MRILLAALVCLVVACATAGGPARAQASLTVEERVATQAAVAAELVSAGIGAPTRIDLLDQATLRLADQLQFIPRGVAVRFLEAFDRPVPPNLIGMLRFGDRPEWFATIRFLGDGFVDPAGLKSWSPDDLLASLRDEIAATNPERERQGRNQLEVTRWLIPPRYDPAAHALEWAALVPPVNAPRERDSETEHNIAVFGRDGCVLIEITAQAGAVRDNGLDYRLIVDNLRFNPGKTFDDYVRGRDRTAPNGLEAVLGVRTLRQVSLLEGQLDSDRIMILAVGGALVVGAGLLGLALVIVNRRRLRR